MFTVRKAVSANLRTQEVQNNKLNKMGTTSNNITQKKLKKAGFTSESSMSQMPITGLGPNVGISMNPITLDLEPLLMGITPQIESTYINRLYRDIYYYDAIAGSTVDLMSTLPFSEFSLGGTENEKILSKFNESIERLNMRTLPGEISIDYLVLGAHVSSLLYNRESKKFTDIMPHAIENVKLDELPFYSQDPIITVRFTEHVRSVLQKDSPRINRIKEQLGQNVIDKIISGQLELDPLSTLYIPRKTFSSTDLGTSYFKRLLPIYLIEKNLFRGTLVESARRQRGILHLTLGDDTWEPTTADMEFMTDLFMGADSDPLGAIIATKMGVSVEELRQGGEFWKVTEFQDSVLNLKLRALGISESFLSGDATYSSADTSMTFFIDMVRSYREMLTRKLFYNKLFPLISLINGYTVNTKGKVSINEGLINNLDSPEDALYEINDGSRLLIPTLTWAKHLRSDVQDQAYFDILNALTEKGVPVPLRMLATAAGVNIDELMKQKSDDLIMRRKLQEYMKALEEFKPKTPEGGSEEGYTEESSDNALVALASEDPTGRMRSAIHARSGAVNIMDRDFGEYGESPIEHTKTGKAKHTFRRTKLDTKINENIAKSMTRLDKEKKTHVLKVSKVAK